MKQRTLKFRQLWKCQNGHPRWSFSEIRPEEQFDQLEFTWGDRQCECPTHDLGEGYSPAAPVQQYTGRKDKNDVEIYEGDLVKANTPYSRDQLKEVVWDEKRAGFYLKCDFVAYDPKNLYKMEVDGNIYGRACNCSQVTWKEHLKDCAYKT
jgi:hypothetical protein